MPDGHVNKCKKCNKKDVKDNYRMNFLHYQEYERNRFKNKERKLMVKLYAENRNKKFPGKYKARNKIGREVRMGRITRKPCESCGDVKSQAHHLDYRQPLSVKWLCFKHHREAHGQIIINK